ncbi:MAG: NUDIX hydrolase [SAR324 cluster bacterium]|nr:NUDIX hydrolase [SAR324 cluster bacterium]MBL7035290.1 NUDIX hydrolase [SAR324 cluster bacterium]
MSTSREYPKRPYVGAAVIVLRDEEVLLIERGKAPNKGQWSLPGGKQRLGETVVQTAHREIYEETGVKVGKLGLVDVVDVIIPDGHGKTLYHYTVIDFLGKWISGDCRAGDDAQAVRWFKLNELDSLSLSTKTKEVILNASSMIEITNTF